MSANPLDRPARTPDAASESRLREIRRQAEVEGRVQAVGVRPEGAPFPQANAQAGYYGMPLLKEPQWTWEIPVYFFIGGAAGAAAVIAAMANWTGADRKLVRDARWVAAAGAALSPALLVSDLGVPSRFFNMLRVFKLQSPMSVGAWVMTAFSSAATATAFIGAMRDRFGDSIVLQIAEGAAESLALAAGLPFNNYTGVLIGATAIPVWNEHVGTLPIHFAASGLGAAVSILELAGHTDSAALNALGIGASLVETLEGYHLESGDDRVNQPIRRGASGWITRAGGVLSGPFPLVLRAIAAMSARDRARGLRRAAAAASITGSLLTRIGWVQAGHESAKDYIIPLQIEPPPERGELPASEKIQKL